MRAVIYARVSADPTRELRSVDGQVTECLAWVQRQDGWTLVREPFTDKQGASRHSKGNGRPQYTALIEYLRAGHADALVLWEGSRAQRDVRDYLKLRDLCAETGVLYCYNGRAYDLTRTDDRFTTGLDALLAEREADVIRDRVRRGKRLAADAGRPPGRLIYGYEREYNERGAFVRQVIQLEQAAVIRECADRAEAGESLTGIAESLNERGVPTPFQARQWRGHFIRRIVLNPAYRGARVHRGQVVSEGPHWPPVIEPEQQLRVTALLTDPRRRTQRGTALKWQLVGAARCAACGDLLKTRATSANRYRANYTSYWCPACGISIRADRADEFIDALMIGRLSRPDAVDLFTPVADEWAVRAALAEEATLRARLESFVDRAAAGELSDESLARIEARLLPQIRQAAGRARALA
ncbi:MAG: recombinase family protein, partial [Micromonosporaceae bacterium]